jgi:uncharacterized protein (DUF1697 family)
MVNAPLGPPPAGENGTVQAKSTFAAFLRGVNVGGKNALPMAELKAVLESLGHEGVVTYLQSGNAVFDATGGADEVAGALEERIGERLGLAVRVLLRTPGELAAVAAANPFLGREPVHARLHVVFLDRAPTPAEVGRVDPERSPGDAFSVAGREIYVHYPHGAGRTKLTLDYFERRLGVVGTARNWNTVLKLTALAGR